MRFCSSYIPTLKESPADAEVISHKLLLRAGMVRKLTSGIYIYMPTALRSLRKLEAIIREEMEKAGFEELLLPAVQPGDLWKESGRWEHYGNELLRFLDRNDREYCLGPTHEEVMTNLVRGEVSSYRQLPVRLYQIQTKFRDERRPRFGLMRGREFIMQDGYSFDVDDAGAEQSYAASKIAYRNSFSRFGLRFRIVEADSGSIGGSFSHEFHVLANSGEDTLVTCNVCDYAANVERAEIIWKGGKCQDACPAHEAVPTPNAHTIEEVSALLKVDPSRIVKTLILVADGKPVAVLVRGDRDANEAKIKSLLKAEEFEFASPEVVEQVTGAPAGFAGPVALSVPVYADNELLGATDYVTGANKADTHYLHVDLARDANITQYADLRVITEHDCCPRCSGSISLTRGIEVGHIFKLGTKYSKPMHCVFLDENGREQVMIMGCYGIGVSRILAAAIEQNYDENGIMFPPAIAPFVTEVINLDPADEKVTAWARKACSIVEACSGECLYDDRTERPGVKFKDADLVGCPVQIVLGGKGIGKGVCETKNRLTGEKGTVPLDNLEAGLKAFVDDVCAQWASRQQQQ